MKYNILMKYGTAKDMWVYYKTTQQSSTSTTTTIYETDDLDELETTLLEIYATHPVSDVRVVSDVTATLDITFS